MPKQNIIDVHWIKKVVALAEEAGVPILLMHQEGRFLLGEMRRCARLEDQRRTWASHINRLSIAIMNGPDPGEENHGFAQEMQEMVVPFLEGHGDRCQYCGKYTCDCVR